MTYLTAMDTRDGVGGRIRAARIARGLTQADLARAVGVSRSAVAQWETERAGQLRGNVSRLASALGMSAGQLIEGDPRAELAVGQGPELAMLNLFRACTEADRQLLLRTALRLARPRPAPGAGET